jgi:prepilin-type N-terminal cleavage/methylation domain-containing protein
MSNLLADRRGYSLIELLVVVGITTVVAAMSVPMMSNVISNFKLSGDAHAVSSAVALAKLRAASDFSQARLYVDLAGRSYHVETWTKTGVPAWTTEGGSTSLSNGVTFSFGASTSPPPSSQAVIGQANACVTSAGAAIGNTACILFNSRGIPVDPAGAPPNVGAPTGNDAIYLTDGTAVFGITVSATGLSKTYRQNASQSTWTLQ